MIPLLRALTVFIISIFMVSGAQAEIQILISGKLLRYDEKSITIKQSEGATIRVPRKNYKGLKGLVPGMSPILVKVTPVELKAFNPALAAKLGATRAAASVR